MIRFKPLPLTERARFLVATAGVALWLTFPFVYMASMHARWLRRCDGRTFSGKFDDCFNDTLPVFEFVAFPLTIALAYLFVRFAFSMFAPSAELRTTRWRLARSEGGADYFPVYQLLSVVGMIWTVLHVRSLPLSLTYWYLLAYWAAWFAWLLTGVLAALPATPSKQS